MFFSFVILQIFASKITDATNDDNFQIESLRGFDAVRRYSHFLTYCLAGWSKPHVLQSVSSTTWTFVNALLSLVDRV